MLKSEAERASFGYLARRNEQKCQFYSKIIKFKNLVYLLKHYT